MPRKKGMRKRQAISASLKERNERKKKEEENRVESDNRALAVTDTLPLSAVTPTPSALFTPAVPSSSSAVFTPVVPSTSSVFAHTHSYNDWSFDDFRLNLSDEESENMTTEEGKKVGDIPNNTNNECLAKKLPAEVRKLFLDKIRTKGEERSDSENIVQVNSSESTRMFPEKVVKEMFSKLSVCKECRGKGKISFTGGDVVIQCDSCDSVLYDKKVEVKNIPGFQRSKTGRLTSAVVYHSIQEGIGHAGVNTLSGALGMPVIPQRVYERNKNYIHKLCKDRYQETQLKVYSAIVNYYRKINIHPDKEGILNIEVIFNASYMTKGHSSNVGVGVLAEAYTRFILDAHVLSKFCQVCNNQKKMLNTKKWTQAEYVEKVEIHIESGKCTKNFEGTSGLMEAEAAKIIWGRSLENKFRYAVFVGDGDSCAYNTVIKMNNGKGPYGEEHPVLKEECINHFAKRLGSRLRNLRERYNYLGSNGKLSDPTIGHLVRHLGNAIRRAKLYKDHEISKLRNDVMATFHHFASTDENPDHLLCPDRKNSWCFYKADIANDKEPRSHQLMKIKLAIPDDAKHLIKDIYESIITDELLLNCIKGRTQTLNNFNEKLWSKCPKVKFHGLNRVITGYYIVACEHNTGYEESSLSREIIGSPPGSAQKWEEKS